MKCREFGGFMLDYLEGNLPSDTLTVFEDHLAHCPNCIKFLSSYRQTIQLEQTLGRNVEEDELTDIPTDLVQAILAARRTQS